MGNQPSDDNPFSSLDSMDEEDADDKKQQLCNGTMELEDDEDTSSNASSDMIPRILISTPKSSWQDPNIDSIYDAACVVDLVSTLENKESFNRICLQQGVLVQYLEGRYSRGETSIGKEQFCTALTKWDLNADDIRRLFALFDTEGREIIDVQSALVLLNSGSLDYNALVDGLPQALQLFHRCALMPGFADFHSVNVDEYYEKDIGHFIDNAKLTAEDLPYVPDTSLDAIFRLKSFVLKELLNSELSLQLHSHVQSTYGDSGARVTQTQSGWPSPSPLAMTRCTNDHNYGASAPPTGAETGNLYELIDVSSNKKDIGKLTDGDPSTYWQSDGSPGAHYIDIKVKSGIGLTSLKILISSGDRNFMPKLVTLSSGRTFDELTPLPQNVEIPAEFDGAFNLGSCPRISRCIRIHIKGCHNDGCDTRVRGIEMEGCRTTDDRAAIRASQLEEASVVWYLNILTSTVEACSPIAPTLKRMIIDHTKGFTKQMAPLSLRNVDTKSAHRRRIILNTTVMDAAEESLERIFSVSSHDQAALADGATILSSFALARTDVNSVFRAARHLINLTCNVSPETVRELRENMETTMMSLFLAHSRNIPCGVIHTNSRAAGFLHDSLDRAFSAEAGTKALDIALGPPCECSRLMLTRMTLKVDPTPTAVSLGATIYAIDDETYLRQFVGSSGEDAVEMDSSRVKVIGRLAIKDQEQIKSDMDVYLEPCIAAFVLIRFHIPQQGGITIRKMSVYGFSGLRRSPALPTVWSELRDETNPNLELASRLIHFAGLIETMARDFSVGDLAIGPSTCRSHGFDWDLLCSCFEILSKKSSISQTLKQTFLQFVADIFQRSLLPPCSFALSQRIWESLIALSEYNQSISLPTPTVRLTMDIITNGIETSEVFYPNVESRREAFYSLLSDCGKWRNELIAKTTFTALCKRFSGPKASRLFHLPYENSAEEHLETSNDGEWKTNVLNIMDTLYVGYTACFISDAKAWLDGSSMQESWNSAVLGSVINKQQMQLFVWNSSHKRNAETQHGHIVGEVIIDLLTSALRHLRRLFDALLEEFKADLWTTFMSSSFTCLNFGSAFNCLYQLAIVALESSFKADLTELMKEWLGVVTDSRLKDFLTMTVQEAAKAKREELTSGKKELVTLMQWTMESPHPRPCPSNVETLFHQPGAVVFQIDFSSSCVTDPSDCFSFVTNVGRRVNADKRPSEKKRQKRMEIQSRDHLQFIFKTNIKSAPKKYWGYKFVVTAKGIPTPVISSWSADLVFTLAQFGGHLFAMRANLVNAEESDICKMLEFGQDTLRHFKSVDGSNREGASLFCLTFLRESLDAVVANVMGRSEGASSPPPVMQQLAYSSETELSTVYPVEYWSLLFECFSMLSSDKDRNLWLLNVLHLFPWRYLHTLDETAIREIIHLVFKTALNQQELLRKKPIELRDEIIDAPCYGTFRDWLAMLQTGMPLLPRAISKVHFNLWREAKFASEDPEEKRLAKLFVSQYSDVLNSRIICHGCGRSLDGIRYHCLDCVDMDLCATCFSLGDWPITHSNDHRLVEFSFRCNNCAGFIIGSRFHCTVCKDYDLCFGCMLNGAANVEEDDESKQCPAHKQGHPSVTFPPVVYRESDCETQMMNQYLAQLCWLFATKLVCSSVRPNQGSPNWGTAVTDILLKTATDQFIIAPNNGEEMGDNRYGDWIWRSRAATARLENNERFLGLMALVCSIDRAFLHGATTIAYKILKSDHNQGDAHNNQLALWLLGKSCLIDGPIGADRALNQCSSIAVDIFEFGSLTCQFLFIFGSACLASKQMHLAATAAWIYRRLLRDEKWSAVGVDYLHSKMVADENASYMETIFAYLIYDGFPALFWRGAKVEYWNERGESQKGVVMEAVENDVFKILIPNRRRFKLIKTNDIRLPVTCAESAPEMITLASLVTNAELNIAPIHVSTNDAWSTIPFAQLWAAALSVKALCSAVERNYDAVANQDELFSTNTLDFCKELTQIAAKSTTMPLGTQEDVLEIVMINLLSSSRSEVGEFVFGYGEDDENGPAKDSVPHKVRAAQECVQAWHKELNVPLSLLWAMYEVKGGDTASVVREVRHLFAMRGFTDVRSQDVAFRAACIERLAQMKTKRRWSGEKHQRGPTDFGLTRLPPASNVLSDSMPLSMAVIDEDEVSDEVGNNAHAWGTGGFGGSEEDEDSGKTNDLLTSALMLQEELQREEKKRDVILRRVASALAVLNARRLLSNLLARWPDKVPLQAQNFRLDRYWELINLIDLLRLTPECVANVPRAMALVFDRCSHALLGPLTYACCHFLQGGSEEIIRRSFCRSTAREEFALPKASCVRISSPWSCGDWTIALDYNNQVAGPVSSTLISPIDVTIFANEFTITFTPGKLSSEKVPLKIHAKSYRYFDTAYEMMRLILNAMRKDEAIRRAVPMGHLWIWLLYECCRTTGQQRSRLLDLLIRLLTVLETEQSGEFTPIELSLAAPLWKLLNDLNSLCAGRGLERLPATGRNLAQFFYVLERLALKRGETSALSLAVCDSKPAIRSYAHGCRLMASICAEIGVNNEITVLLQSMVSAFTAKCQPKEEGASTTKNKIRVLPPELCPDSDDGSLADLTTDEDSEINSDESEWS